MSIRKTLQSEIFSAQKERLLHTIPVVRASKRKKHALLCITANNEGNEIFIYKIKKQDKNETFKKIACWPLTSLKKVDGHTDIPDSLQFDIYFEKAYLWESGNTREKDLFLNTLYKICKRYLSPLDMMPEFINMPAHLEDEIQGSKDLFLTTGRHALSTSASKATQNGIASLPDHGLQGAGFGGQTSPYQLVSAKEESDLQRLMAQHETGQNMLSNVEAFSEKLAKELNILDGANIYSLVGSEDSMGKLMGLIDAALSEVSGLEAKLSDWDTCVSSMRGHMEMMDEKDTSLHVIDKNKLALQQELASLLENLEYPSHYKKMLTDVDLNDTARLKDCIRAAFELQKVMDASQSNAALKKMAAVQEKFNEFEVLKNTFSKRLLQHLVELFSKVANRGNENFGTAQSGTLPRSPSGGNVGLPYGSGEWGITGLKDYVRQHHKTSSVGLDRQPLVLNCPSSKYRRETLLPYRELVKWLKGASPETYVDLLKAYGVTFARIYERSLHDFLERAKVAISNLNGPQPTGQQAAPKSGVVAPAMPATGSFRSTTTSFTSPLSERKRDWFEEIGNKASGSPTTSNSTGSGATALLYSGESVDFQAVLERIITSVALMVKEEQDFSTEFFHLVRGTSIELQSQIPLQPYPLSADLSGLASRHSVTSISPQKGALLQAPAKPVVYSPDMDDRAMLVLMFPSLPLELDNFLQMADRINRYFPIQALVRFMSTCLTSPASDQTSPTDPKMGNRVSQVAAVSRSRRDSLESTGSSSPGRNVVKINTEGTPFLRLLFLNCAVTCKRYMDKFMNSVIKSIDETRASKKTKNGGGFLPFVEEFKILAENLENIFKQGGEMGHRIELDKWYTILVRSIFNNINRIAVEHPKLPRDVVLFENYHSMYTALSSLKIAHLEMERKEAKMRYKQHIYSYVESILGKPMEKLNIFFEGVENKVSQGIKESEISYQIAFSKTELKKVIKDYPGKEVKRQLESLYKLVEKHVGEDNSLLQVVWRSVQEEFIKHYKNLEGLIAKCYPNSQIALEFSLNELLQYFSEIAQQH